MYVDILADNLRNSVERLYDHEDWIFMQDNAPSHSSKLTMQYLEEKGVSLMEWPANSPDLNPIENIWGEIKRRLHFSKPRNQTELKNQVEHIWNYLGEKYINNLIESMPNRVAAVIENHGGATKY